MHGISKLTKGSGPDFMSPDSARIVTPGMGNAPSTARPETKAGTWSLCEVWFTAMMEWVCQCHWYHSLDWTVTATPEGWMAGMPAVAALQTADGMGSAVISMIVDAGSGSGPRASVTIRDELLCFLNLQSFLKMVFISLSESWCSKRGDKVARKKEQCFKFQLRSVSDPSFSSTFLCLSNNSDNYHHPNLTLLFFNIYNWTCRFIHYVFVLTDEQQTTYEQVLQQQWMHNECSG